MDGGGVFYRRTSHEDDDNIRSVELENIRLYIRLIQADIRRKQAQLSQATFLEALPDEILGNNFEFMMSIQPDHLLQLLRLPEIRRAMEYFNVMKNEGTSMLFGSQKSKMGCTLKFISLLQRIDLRGIRNRMGISKFSKFLF